jgi:hypothetical protein
MRRTRVTSVVSDGSDSAFVSWSVDDEHCQVTINGCQVNATPLSVELLYHALGEIFGERKPA